MIKKRYLILALGVVSVLLASLLVNNVILAQTSGEYDPWMDLNDDGIIDATDLQALASIYGTLGEPINKTALLLELQSAVESLNRELILVRDDLDDLSNSVAKNSDSISAVNNSIVSVNNTLNVRVPVFDVISIPAGAFVCSKNQYPATIEWYILWNDGDLIMDFSAGVQLPHGATVKKLTSYWVDAGVQSVLCALYRINATTWEGLGWTYSTGDAGSGSNYDNTIEYATVDNRNFAYVLRVELPPTYAYMFKYAVIEYEYPE